MERCSRNMLIIIIIIIIIMIIIFIVFTGNCAGKDRGGRSIEECPGWLHYCSEDLGREKGINCSTAAEERQIQVTQPQVEGAISDNHL